MARCWIAAMPAWALESQPIVCPSGAERTSSCVAIMPLAPGRFSMTSGWPRWSAIAGCMVRAMMSVAPPGAKPMSTRTGREGKAPPPGGAVCADAGAAVPSRPNAAAVMAGAAASRPRRRRCRAGRRVAAW
jgi:hypothetical protein